jgi:hypothetical protein
MSLSKHMREAADQQLSAQVTKLMDSQHPHSQHPHAIAAERLHASALNDVGSLSGASSVSSLKSSAQSPLRATKNNDNNSRFPQLKVSKSVPNGLPLSPSQRQPPVASKNQFERLSGLYDYSVSAGVFADPSLITKPLTRCVRCSNHASICMPCTEYLCDESLTFYRKTRARGAIKLFHNAVTEAGLGRLLKFTLFRMWRNAVVKWKNSMLKKKFIVERMFGLNITAIPFKAWQQYTRQTKISRRDIKIAELHAKVDTLTESMTQLSESNTEYMKQVSMK